MAGTIGAAAPAVASPLEKLRAEPYRFDFYQAMRMLECAFDDAPRIGRSMRLQDEPVRLTQEPSLRFAPASLADFGPANNPKYNKLAVQFFGLCGPNGALPLHLTEYVRDRMRHHDDHTIAAFLDVFHHRMLSLFYRAWADSQPTVHRDRPDTDRFAMYVGSLLGIGMPTLRNRDALPDEAKLHYAGRSGCQTRNPEGLQAMLAGFFELPVQIEEFIGQWVEIPEDYRFYLGDSPQTSTLGVGCTLGSHVWDCQQKFRITIGPVDWDAYLKLLPGGESLPRLTALVKNYIGDELSWDVNLVLRHDETPSWSLGHQRLGQTAWMDNAGVKKDRRDLLIKT